MDWRTRQRPDALETASMSRHMTGQLAAEEPGHWQPSESVSPMTMEPGKMDGFVGDPLSPTIRSPVGRPNPYGSLPSVRSPQKAARFGSGNRNAPQQRMSRWAPQSHSSSGVPEKEQSLPILTGRYRSRPTASDGSPLLNGGQSVGSGLHSAYVMPEQDLTMTTSLERGAIKAVQAREEILSRVMMIASKLDGKAEETMGFLSSMNPSVKLFYRMVATLRIRTVDVVETIVAWQRAHGSQSNARPFIWQGEEYLAKVGPDLAFLQEVESLSTRLPLTRPESIDPFLATVTPDGIPLDEPGTIRVGSSRKGGEAQRVAMARRMLASMLPAPEDSAPPTPDTSSFKPLASPLQGRSASPRQAQFRLAPLSPSSRSSPGSPGLVPHPPTGSLPMSPRSNAATVAPSRLPSLRSIGSPTPGLASELVGNAFASQGLDMASLTSLRSPRGDELVAAVQAAAVGETHVPVPEDNTKTELQEPTLHEDKSHAPEPKPESMHDVHQAMDDVEVPEAATIQPKDVVEIMEERPAAQRALPKIAQPLALPPAEEVAPTPPAAKIDTDDSSPAPVVAGVTAQPVEAEEPRAGAVRAEVVRLELLILNSAGFSATGAVSKAKTGPRQRVSLGLAYTPDGEAAVPSQTVAMKLVPTGQDDTPFSVSLVAGDTGSAEAVRLRLAVISKPVAKAICQYPQANVAASACVKLLVDDVPTLKTSATPAVALSLKVTDSPSQPIQLKLLPAPNAGPIHLNLDVTDSPTRPVQLSLAQTDTTAPVRLSLSFVESASQAVEDAETSLQSAVAEEYVTVGLDFQPAQAPKAQRASPPSVVSSGGRVGISLTVVDDEDSEDTLTAASQDTNGDLITVKLAVLPAAAAELAGRRAPPVRSSSAVLDSTSSAAIIEIGAKLLDDAAWVWSQASRSEDGIDESAQAPEVVRASALAGLALQWEAEYHRAAQVLAQSLQLHHDWMGPTHPATALVQLMGGAAGLMARLGGFDPSDAQLLLEEQVAASGPDSLPVGDAAAEAAWLLLISGYLPDAARMAEQAYRVRWSWLGPQHPAVTACHLLAEVIDQQKQQARLGAEAHEGEGIDLFVPAAVVAAAELAERLLDKLSSDSGGETAPAGVRQAALTGVVLQMQNAVPDAVGILHQAALQHDSWLGPLHPETVAVNLFHDAANLLHTKGHLNAPRAADAFADATLAHGPDSLQAGHTAAQLAWLLLAGGYATPSLPHAQTAARVLRSWHGPHHSITAVTEALLGLARATATANAKRPSHVGEAMTARAELEVGSPEYAAAVAERLLRAAAGGHTRDGGADDEEEDGVPEMVMATAVAAVVLQYEGDGEAAGGTFEQAVGLYRSWGGEGSVALELCKVMAAARALEERTPTHGLAGAQALLQRQALATGTDSLPVADLAAQSAWLCLMDGNDTAAAVLARTAQRLMCAWHGPESPMAAAAAVMAAEAAGYQVDRSQDTKTPPEPSPVVDSRVSSAEPPTPPLAAPVVAPLEADSSMAVMQIAIELLDRAVGWAQDASTDADESAQAPEVVRASALAGLAVQWEAEYHRAAQVLAQSLQLHHDWMGPTHPATALVQLMGGAAGLMARLGGFDPSDAQLLLEEQVAASGPDSLPVGDAAAEASWLLLISGYLPDAARMAEEAYRVRWSWLGPQHPAVTACHLLAEVIEQQERQARLGEETKEERGAMDGANDPDMVAASLAEALLDKLSSDAEGETAPAGVRQAALTGIVLQVQNAVPDAVGILHQAALQHDSWLGPFHPETVAVNLFHDAANLLHTKGHLNAPRAADTFADATLAHGPDSLQAGHTAAQLAWLLLAGGYATPSLPHAQTAARVLRSWHGPHHSITAVTEALLGLARATATANAKRPSHVGEAITARAELEVGSPEYAAAVAERLLRAAAGGHTRDGGADDEEEDGVPEMVMATAVAAVVLQYEGDGEAAGGMFEQAVGLYRSWGGEGSVALELCKVMAAARALEERTPTHGLAGAQALLQRQALATGTDSLPLADLAAQSAWLCLMDGNDTAAAVLARTAERLMCAWHGPDSPMAAAAAIMAAEAAGCQVDRSQDTKTPPEPSPEVDSRASSAEPHESRPAAPALVAPLEADSSMAVTEIAIELLDRAEGWAQDASTDADESTQAPEVVRASALAGLAVQWEAEYHRAAQVLAQSLQLHHDWMGPTHPATALVQLMGGAAGLMARLGGFDPSDAQLLLEEQVAASGPDSLPVGDAAAEAAWLLLISGYLPDAARMAEEAYRVRWSWLGPQHPAVTACHLLADEIGQQERQARLGEETKEERGATDGANDPDMVAASLAEALLDKLSSDAGDETAPAGVRQAALTGIVLQVRGEISDAVGILHQAALQHDSWLGPLHPETVAVNLFHDAATLLHTKGHLNAPRAADTFADATLAHGPDSLQAGHTAAQLAWLLLAGGYATPSLPHAQTAARVLRSWHGPHHPFTAVAEALLGLARATATTNAKRPSHVGEAITARAELEVGSPEYAAAVAERLLRAAAGGHTRDGGADDDEEEGVPEMVMATAVAAVVLQYEGDGEAAGGTFEQAVGLYRSWGGEGSVALELCKVMAAAQVLEESTPAAGAFEAEELLRHQASVSGPQSLAQAELAASLVWLCLMDGDTETAAELALTAVQILDTWHGPHSPAAAAAQLLLAEAQGQLADAADVCSDDEPPSPMVTKSPGGTLTQSLSFASIPGTWMGAPSLKSNALTVQLDVEDFGGAPTVRLFLGATAVTPDEPKRRGMAAPSASGPIRVYLSVDENNGVETVRLHIQKHAEDTTSPGQLIEDAEEAMRLPIPQAHVEELPLETVPGLLSADNDRPAEVGPIITVRTTVKGDRVVLQLLDLSGEPLVAKACADSHTQASPAAGNPDTTSGPVQVRLIVAEDAVGAARVKLECLLRGTTVGVEAFPDD